MHIKFYEGLAFTLKTITRNLHNYSTTQKLQWNQHMYSPTDMISNKQAGHA